MRIVLTTAMMLALVACGENQTKRTKQTVTTADGSNIKVEQTVHGDQTIITTNSAAGTATMTSGGGDWPVGLADYAPPYPNSTLGGSFSRSSNDGAGGMVIFTTDESPAKVIAFYKSRATSAALKGVSSMDINGAKMFSANDPASGRSLAIQTRIADDGKTIAVISFGTNRK